MESLDRAFTFPFHQKEWGLKFFIGALFLLLSVLGIGIPVIAGYMVRVCQRFMRKDQELLPAWEDVGVMFITGMKYIAVTLIYQLPVLLLMIPLLAFAVLGAMIEPAESASMIFGLYLFGILLLAIPYVLLYTILSPVITYRFAVHERISEGLDVARVFREFRQQWANVALSAVLIVIVGILSVLGVLLFVVGILATVFYSSLVSAALSGMLYRKLNLPPGEKP